VRNNVRFSSGLFAEADAGDTPPGPGRGGGRLAAWLQLRLRDHGVPADGPVLEDWGCLVTVDGPDARLMIGCGPVDGEERQWLVFVEPRSDTRGIWARLFSRKQPADPALARFCTRLDGLLRGEPEITAIEWFSVDPQSGAESDHGPTPLRDGG
jgi:hypothetical protein